MANSGDIPVGGEVGGGSCAQLREVVLEAMEASLEAQLSAVRKLRRAGGEPVSASGTSRRGSRSALSRSNLDVVFDVLSAAGGPLHVSEVLARARAAHGRQLDRESLVSSLTKCVARGDRFTRPAPNTFGLRAAPARSQPGGADAAG